MEALRNFFLTKKFITLENSYKEGKFLSAKDLEHEFSLDSKQNIERQKRKQKGKFSKAVTAQINIDETILSPDTQNTSIPNDAKCNTEIELLEKTTRRSELLDKLYCSRYCDTGYDNLVNQLIDLEEGLSKTN